MNTIQDTEHEAPSGAFLHPEERILAQLAELERAQDEERRRQRRESDSKTIQSMAALH